MDFRRLSFGLSLLAIASACSASEGASDEAPEITSAGGKSDLADLAKPLAYDTPVTGDVTEGNFVLFKLEGEPGESQIELQIVRTSGSFDPRADAYSATGTDIPHDAGSFRRVDAGAIKTVSLPGLTDDPLIAVSAHNGQGAGGFELTVRCVSGACTGAQPNRGGQFHASLCLANATDCLFRQDPASGQGPSALATCLLSATGIEGTCAGACDVDDDSKQACDEMAKAAEDFAGRGGQCVNVLNDCLGDCLDQEQNSPSAEGDDAGFVDTGVGRCWLDPNLFGTCDEFIRTAEECGGNRRSVYDMDYGMCFNYCEAVHGGWQSDVDETCDEFCITEVCEGIYEDCEERCSSDMVPDGCFESCVEDDERNATHTGSTCSDYI